MSADEDSFIVLEETPSMLQFSILDSISSNRPIEQDTKLHSTNVISDETNTTLFTSAFSQDNQNVDLSSYIDDKSVECLSMKCDEMMQSNVSDISTNTPKSSEVSASHTSISKNTLAQSFLLGDIDCDIMKVRRDYTFMVLSEIFRV